MTWEEAIEEAWDGPCDHYHSGIWNVKDCRRNRIARALTKSGHTVIKTPEDMDIAHGKRLLSTGFVNRAGELYVFEEDE